MRSLGAVLLVFHAFSAAASDEHDLPRYRDVAPELGLTRPNHFGSEAKKIITATTGSGVAFLDYDGDGDQDLYVVNGKTLEEAESGSPGEPNPLFRNLGQARFELGSSKASASSSFVSL